ncbi:MAG: DHA2 family efflux MFS transporter permease subunit [Hyphomicrobiaceae bacterium]
MAISTQTEELTPLRRGFILIASVLTVTLYFTSILVVSTVLPQIQGGMSATADEVSWIVTFNILAIAIATPMTGWLVARFGRKGVMCGCAGAFTVTTLMCALAGSLESLIFWRIIQGAVGAPTVPLAQTILLDNYPKEKHQFVMGLNGIGVVLGPIIGPTVAGYVAEAYGWRWAFMLLIPVAATGFLALVYALPRDTAGEKVKLDWIGFLSLSTAVAGLQYVLARGHRLDWFESNEIILASLIAALAFYVFLSHSLTAKQPFLNLGLLRNRNLALGYVLVSIFGMLNFTPMVLMPTLLRQYVEYPDALIGIVIGSRGVGGMIGFLLAMSTHRLDARLSMATGFCLLTIAGYWMMHFDLNVTALEIALNGILQGACVGMIYVPLSVIAFSDLDPKHRPETIGVFHLVRNVASSLFISICVAETIRSTGVNYARLVEFINPYNPSLTLPTVIGGWNTSTLPGLALLSKEISRQSAMIAYLNTFGMFTLMSALAVPMALLMGSGDNRARSN